MRTDIATVREIPEMHNMGHTCVSLNGELLLVWGGVKERVSVNAKNSSIWIYETLTGYWRHRSCSGECPPYVTSSASCLMGQKMYIFGGFSAPKDNWLDCFYCLDLETFSWTNLGAQARAHPTKPIRSDKNVAWSYEGKVYVFGGFGWCQIEHYTELLNCQKDLQLVPDDQRHVPIGWNNQLVEYNPKDKTWRWPSYSGCCPSARAAHSGALMGDKYFVFGGRDGFERLNDLHTLDMRTFTWQKIALISFEPDHIQRALRAPINHLLEDQSRDDQRAESPSESVRGQDEPDDSHRQIVEEMHEVAVEEEEEDEERWNLPTSSQPIISDHDQVEDDDEDQSKQDTEDQEFEDGDFGYSSNPSHLLERWSFSSSCNNDSQQANIGAFTEPPISQQVSQQVTPMSGTAIGGSRHEQHQLEENVMLQSQSYYAESRRQALLSQRQLEDQGDNPEDLNQQQLSRVDNGSQAEELLTLPQPPTAHSDHQDHRAPEANDNGQPPHTRAPPSMPVGRSFCSLTPISSNEMLLFGGVNSQDEKLDDCWIYNTTQNRWIQVDHMKSNNKLIRPRLWHTGARTKQNEVVILGGSASDDLNEYCTDVLLISFEPRTLKRLALDTVSRAVRMKTIQRTRGIPSTLMKLIKLRKQAMALTTYRQDNSNLI